MGGKDGQVKNSLMIKSCACYVKTDSGFVTYKETNKKHMKVLKRQNLITRDSESLGLSWGSSKSSHVILKKTPVENHYAKESGL